LTSETHTTHISGIDDDPTLRIRVARRMAAALAPLTVRPVRSQALFVDDNGPKGGPAQRCALTVRLPHRPSVRVERRAETPRLAFDAAIDVLERQLARYRERDRDSKRHPKKYFAAARAMATGRPRSTGRTRGA
jgi:ribosome-associated translation inhibitor RaiA